MNKKEICIIWIKNAKEQKQKIVKKDYLKQEIVKNQTEFDNDFVEDILVIVDIAKSVIVKESFNLTAKQPKLFYEPEQFPEYEAAINVSETNKIIWKILKKLNKWEKKKCVNVKIHTFFINNNIWFENYKNICYNT